LASYHRRGKERRRQRLAQEAASKELAPSVVAQRPDDAATDVGKDPVHSSECLTQKTVGEAAGQGATVGAARAVSAVQEPVSRGEAELVDAKLLLATVAQAQAVLQDARRGGLDDVVLWGRCARCGRVGRVVHFDGELRARAQALE
jgi:hypothetical protein